jgi:hypothetical protein
MLTAYDSHELRRVVLIATQVEGTRKKLKSERLDRTQRVVRQRCYHIQLDSLHRAVVRAEHSTGDES